MLTLDHFFSLHGRSGALTQVRRSWRTGRERARMTGAPLPSITTAKYFSACYMVMCPSAAMSWQTPIKCVGKKVCPLKVVSQHKVGWNKVWNKKRTGAKNKYTADCPRGLNDELKDYLREHLEESCEPVELMKALLNKLEKVNILKTAFS